MKRPFFQSLAAASLLVLAAVPSSPAETRQNVDAGQSMVFPPQAVRASASYSLAEETTDLGGGSLIGSAAYTVSGTAVGQPAAASVQTSTAYADKPGYVGQLYDVQGLAVTGAASVNENATTQLGVAPLLDDGTLLAALDPTQVAWSVVSGPLTSVSTAGVAKAGSVYQNTAATVGVVAGSLRGMGTLTVLNVNNDNYGTYAGDGIDDAWQVMYFGQPPNPRAGPLVDADGTGQNNLFKYLAGLSPLDPTSRFVLVVSAAAGQTSQKTLTFSPVYNGRTYTVQYTTSLTQPNWAPLTGATASVTGSTETVTDPGATTSPRFYRVQVSLP